MNAEFSWPIRVYYEDTDAAGVVYYANYLKFYERARTEWLNCLNINQAELLNQNKVFVVTKADISYLKPAKLNDYLVIHSRIKKARLASVEFEQKLFLQPPKKTTNNQMLLLNQATVKVACLTVKTFSPCRIPADIREEFQRVS